MILFLKLYREVLMMKLKKLIKKHVCNATTSALIAVASAQADQGCYFIFYQPKAPKGLKDFSKAK